jgi:hypothetical protein
MWTVALVPIRFTGPRPRFRRLTRQPGIIAALAAILAILIVSVQIAILLTKVELDLALAIALAATAAYPGLAVLVAWMTLLVGQRWRAEPSWLDRMGRALGIFWIAAGVVILGMLLFGSH